MPDSAIEPGRSDAYQADDCPGFSVNQELSDRELEVLALAARGCTDKEIGRQLTPRISPRTARAHIQNACRKLGARGRTNAAVIAVKRQLISV
jgi:DNA-binding NarL/FixJ family response regulator